jgi:hypothetical protein
MLKFGKAFYVRSAVVGSIAFCVQSASAAVIADWNFANTTKGTVVTSIPATTGSGTASSLGMTNAYTYANGEGPGAVDGSNYAGPIASAADATFSESTWKIVGNSNTKNAGTGKADGWNNSAPNYTQGAEFAESTLGYTLSTLSFDWYCTTQGVANLEVLYTTNGTTFTPIGSDYIATANDYYGATSTSVPQPNITVNLLGLPGADNNPLFAVEMVSVKPIVGDSDYSATGPGADGNYAAASGDTSSATATDYNNNSGNWSFDNIQITGTAVPEPTSALVLGVAAVALLGRRRHKTA